MKYRADIDGLRAVAVLPVVFFHAGWSMFSGGYVGVDIFFVISGFLITGILTEEFAENRFSILNFYERRMRRILPCLFAVIAACSVSAVFLLTPRDFTAFAESVLATVAFVSNVLFYTQSGYFEEQAAIKPLLHTWSLAVEEQFYILFPLLLWLIRRWAAQRFILVLAPLTALSFAACLWSSDDFLSFAFYMAPTRVWELFVGALLALGAAPRLNRGALREALSWGGIGLVAASVFLYSSETRFPGLPALAPVAGAALLIQYAPETSVGRLLSLRPLVFVGLISYSLYLWHWPIIVFAEYVLVGDLPTWGSVAAIVVSLAIAALSWRYVEQQFRIRGHVAGRGVSRRGIFAGSIIAASALAAFGFAAIAGDGWPGRMPAEVVRLEAAAGASSPRRLECHRGERLVIPIEASCRYGSDAPPAYAVWGDSHAVELAYALGEVAGRHGASLLQMSYSSCPPAQGLEVKRRRKCRAFNEAAAAFLARDPNIATVFLIARYDSHERSTAFAEGIRRSVQTLRNAGKRVVLVDPIPVPRINVPHALARYAAMGRDLDSLAITESDYLRRNANALRLLESLSGPDVIRVPLRQRLCPDGACMTQVNGTPLYFDHHHLSMSGARYLMPLFEDFFRSQ